MDAKQFVEQYYVDRMGTSSLKWDALDVRFGDKDLISMWVADMEFRVPQCVIDSLKKRVEHGIYGYSFIPDSYYEAVIDWEFKHHGYKLAKEWIRVSPGVVAALYWSVNMFTEPNDKVLILTPVYYPFHNCVKDSGRQLVTCDLDYNKGEFSYDAAKFEKAIIDNNIKMYILCSPHNPAGRVWSYEELQSMLSICKKHNVFVVSDEIHQDLVFGDNKHIPAATVDDGAYTDNLITCFASSKTFNLATCLTSTIVIENEELRKKWDTFTNVYHNVEVNIFGITAVEAALRGGEEWYEGVKNLIYSNYELVKEGFKEFNQVYLAPLQGTYLLFVDLRNYVPLEDMKKFTQEQSKLAVDYGEWFGASWKGFIRLNLATHPDIVKQAVKNITDNLRALKSKA